MINPKNIHCLALSYKGVGNSNEEPLYFVKSLSSLCFENSKVPYPEDVNKMWTEVELGVIIKKDCFNISEEKITQYIEGYTICADITVENLYNRDHHLGFSKSRLNFCPTKNKITFLNLNENSSLELRTIINGKLTQKGNLKDMKFNLFKMISYISKIVCLKKGDLILTGTPKGVENNILKKGDKVKHLIEGLGELNYEII